MATTIPTRRRTLLGLPREMRNAVYAAVAEDIVILPATLWHHKSALRTTFDLRLTCKQVRNELDEYIRIQGTVTFYEQATAYDVLGWRRPSFLQTVFTVRLCFDMRGLANIVTSADETWAYERYWTTARLDAMEGMPPLGENDWAREFVLASTTLRTLKIVLPAYEGDGAGVLDAAVMKEQRGRMVETFRAWAAEVEADGFERGKLRDCDILLRVYGARDESEVLAEEVLVRKMDEDRGFGIWDMFERAG